MEKNRYKRLLRTMGISEQSTLLCEQKLLTSHQIFRYAVPARTVTKKALSHSMLDIRTYLSIFRCLLCTCSSYYVLIVFRLMHWQCWLVIWPITTLRGLANLGNLTCWCAIKKLLGHSLNLGKPAVKKVYVCVLSLLSTVSNCCKETWSFVTGCRVWRASLLHQSWTNWACEAPILVSWFLTTVKCPVWCFLSKITITLYIMFSLIVLLS